MFHFLGKVLFTHAEASVRPLQEKSWDLLEIIPRADRLPRLLHKSDAGDILGGPYFYTFPSRDAFKMQENHSERTKLCR